MYTTGRATLQRRLLRWYSRNARDLPWRKTRDPYAVLVSELMLQQTQVARVRPVYERFLARFPTLRAVARAPLAAVLREWAGLGYNRRAVNLHRTAREAVGALPADAVGLRALPGIGPYTASAILCFAHGRPEAFADTNIKRVLGRIALGRVVDLDQAVALDARLLPRRRAAAWHHALMDLGATVCVGRRPRCEACPVAPLCAARGTAGEPAERRQSPFATSDRRVRGAIVRVLRGAPGGLTRSAMVKMLEADARVPRLVDRLAEEGLVTIRRGRVALGGG